MGNKVLRKVPNMQSGRSFAYVAIDADSCWVSPLGGLKVAASLGAKNFADVFMLHIHSFTQTWLGRAAKEAGKLQSGW